MLIFNYTIRVFLCHKKQLNFIFKKSITEKRWLNLMEKLTSEYAKTAHDLYLALKKTNHNIRKYGVLVAQYQHACAVHRQLTNYCKVRGLL